MSDDMIYTMNVLTGKSFWLKLTERSGENMMKRGRGKVKVTFMIPEEVWEEFKKLYPSGKGSN
jgi:hypothetical protein